MTTTTVAGPFDEKAARETAAFLGNDNHSVFSRYRKDEDGFETAEKEWFVERDDTKIPERIVGMDWRAIQAKQQRRNA